MALDATKKAPDLDSADISEELRTDIALFRALKPYLGHCLTLNHDLNNPLAGILGYAEFLLSDDNLTTDQKHSLGQIVTCAERMKIMIEALCDHKIELSEKIDMDSITDAYVKVAKKLD
jgi:signal transduction histidine kinase